MHAVGMQQRPSPILVPNYDKREFASMGAVWNETPNTNSNTYQWENLVDVSHHRWKVLIG